VELVEVKELLEVVELEDIEHLFLAEQKLH
jgi:hypothetical protein